MLSFPAAGRKLKNAELPSPGLPEVRAQGSPQTPGAWLSSPQPGHPAPPLPVTAQAAGDSGVLWEKTKSALTPRKRIQAEECLSTLSLEGCDLDLLRNLLPTELITVRSSTKKQYLSC